MELIERNKQKTKQNKQTKKPQTNPPQKTRKLLLSHTYTFFLFKIEPASQTVVRVSDSQENLVVSFFVFKYSVS